MAWLALVTAGLMEVFGVWNMKRVLDKKWDAIIFMFVGFGISFSLLSFAMQTIPMGTAYGVWTGIGAAGSTIMGMVLFNEPKEWKRVLFITLIICSTIGLKLFG